MRDDYFKIYEDVEVQRLMLDDKPRTEAYKAAIFKIKNKLTGKVVLDVGSGTGILSVFCAQAGAKKVHAVEASNMAKLSKDIIKENFLSDVVEVHECLVSDLKLEEKVDVIVSEWMGFFLFHEGMLSAVIEARDRFLKPDGFLIPESADLWVAPCRLPRFFSYWSDVYGVKMRSLGKSQRENQKEPVVINVDKNDLIGEESMVKSVILKTVTLDELKEFKFRTLVVAMAQTQYQGLCLWFKCNFNLDNGEFLYLSTKPGESPTHWKQTAIVYPFEIEVEEGDAIAFELLFRSRLDDPKKYTIEVTMLDPEKEKHPTPCQCSRLKCHIIREFIKSSQNANNQDENILEEEAENKIDQDENALESDDENEN